MAELSLPFFETNNVTFLRQGDISDVLLAEIEWAKERLWGCYFMVVMTNSTDPHRTVRDLCDSIIKAERRGVDVRLIMDHFELVDKAFEINLVAAHYLLQHNVPVRFYKHIRKSSTHSKYLLVDQDIQIVGSGNLSQGGLDANIELALRTESIDLNRWMSNRFNRNWQNAETVASIS